MISLYRSQILYMLKEKAIKTKIKQIKQIKTNPCDDKKNKAYIKTNKTNKTNSHTLWPQNLYQKYRCYVFFVICFCFCFVTRKVFSIGFAYVLMK